MSTFGDRRRHERLEVIGSLRATLEIGNRVEALNVGRGGALIRSSIPALVDSVHTVTLVLKGERVRVDARVRHLTLLAEQGTGSRYQLGVEFLDMPEAPASILG